jgi:hypothetical protein
VTTPIRTVNDSFFENMNVGFGFGIHGAGFIPNDDRGPGATIGLDATGAPTPNLNLPFGWGGGGVRPPFGAGGAGGGATFGFGTNGSGFNTGTNLNFSQGSSRSMVMQAPTVVIPNGGQGTLIDTIQRPFVTGFIPVVGGVGAPVVVGGYGIPGGFGQPISPPVSPLFERIQRLNAQGGLQRQAQQRAEQRAAGGGERMAMGGGGNASGPSTAEHGDLSVAEIRRQQAADSGAADKDLATWIERARGAEAAGKKNVARIYYRMAAGRATGELKQQMVAKYRELGGEQP